MHVLIRADQIKPEPGPASHSKGFSRFKALGVSSGAVHTDIGFCHMEAGGRLDQCVQSYEEQFYVTEGNPVLVMNGMAVRLVPGACGVIPIGTPHAWFTEDAPARWIDNLTPRPRTDAAKQDTFFVGQAPNVPVTDIDIRDPRSKNLFRMRDADIDLDQLKLGSKVNAPTVSASMATAVLAYSGIAVKMLVDQRMGASQATMFMVDYQPGAVAHPHDHPLEEAYMMLEGEVDVVADDVRYTIYPGDFFWTGVGCIHAFYNVSGKRVRWLETSSPQPPFQHSYRFSRDWEYLTETLGQPGARAE